MNRKLLRIAAASMCRSSLYPNHTTSIRMKLARVLDWSAEIVQLTPVLTPMDGNCLPHAVALALYGSADSGFMLRSALESVLAHEDSRRLFAQSWVHYMCRRDAEDALSQVCCSYRSEGWTSLALTVLLCIPHAPI